MDATRKDLDQDRQEKADVAALNARIEKQAAAQTELASKNAALEKRDDDLESALAGLRDSLEHELSEYEPLKKLAGVADHIHRALGLPKE